MNQESPPALMERVPPQSMEAEKAVLGAMMLEKLAIAEVVDFLNPEDFYRDIHRQLYQAMIQLFLEGEPVDLVTLGERLRSRGQLEQVGDMPYLLHLQESAPSSAAVGHYARIVREKARLRELILTAQNAADAAYEPSAQSSIVLARQTERLANIEPVGVDQVYLIPVLDIIAEPQPPPPWVVQPLGAKGCVTLCHGAPQRGKSWLALHVALCIAVGQRLFGEIPCQQEGECIVWDAQLSEHKRWLVDRRLAALCMGMELNGSSPLPVYLFNGRGKRIDEPQGYQTLRRLLKERRPLFLAIDALVNLHSADENDNMAMQRVMEPISDLAGEFGCLIWLNHHDRKGQPGMGEDPPAHSVRGASAILAEVDTAIALRYAAPYLIFHHTKDRLSGKPQESFTFQIQGQADQGEPVRLVYHRQIQDDYGEQAKLELQIKATFEADPEKELYGAQLAGILHCEGRAEKMMLYRALSALQGQGWLTLSRQEGKARYFRLNPEHFGR